MGPDPNGLLDTRPVFSGSVSSVGPGPVGEGYHVQAGAALFEHVWFRCDKSEKTKVD